MGQNDAMENIKYNEIKISSDPQIVAESIIVMLLN